MPQRSVVLNGKKVSVGIENNVCMVWVLRDGLGASAPAAGCGTGACQGCTSHLSGKHADPCAEPVGDQQATDRVTAIEGLPKTVNGNPWARDVACGYCQPGQIMAATALIHRVTKSGRKISESDLETLRNVCRCGTFPDIRESVKVAASRMRPAA